MKKYLLLFSFFLLGMALSLGCTTRSKEAEIPKNFQPMPTEGPITVGGPGGGSQGDAQVPKGQKPAK